MLGRTVAGDGRDRTCAGRLGQDHRCAPPKRPCPKHGRTRRAGHGSGRRAGRLHPRAADRRIGARRISPVACSSSRNWRRKIRWWWPLPGRARATARHAQYALPTPVYPEVDGRHPAGRGFAAAAFRIAAPLVTPRRRRGRIRPNSSRALAGLAAADRCASAPTPSTRPGAGSVFTYADAKATPVKELKADDFWKALNAGRLLDRKRRQAQVGRGPGQDRPVPACGTRAGHGSPAASPSANRELPPLVSPLMTKLYQESNLRLAPNRVALHPDDARAAGLDERLHAPCSKRAPASVPVGSPWIRPCRRASVLVAARPEFRTCAARPRAPRWCAHDRATKESGSALRHVHRRRPLHRLRRLHGGLRRGKQRPAGRTRAPTTATASPGSACTRSITAKTTPTGARPSCRCSASSAATIRPARTSARSRRWMSIPPPASSARCRSAAWAAATAWRPAPITRATSTGGTRSGPPAWRRRSTRTWRRACAAWWRSATSATAAGTPPSSSAAAAGKPEIEAGDYVPACVEACPTGAIRFGDLNDPASAAGPGATTAGQLPPARKARHRAQDLLPLQARLGARRSPAPPRPVPERRTSRG